jgi:hypothetical protein
MKTCNLCFEEKELSEFNKHKECIGGRESRCRSCKAEQRREYAKNFYEKNKETIAIKYKKRYEENKEEILTRCKSYYEKNKEIVLERARAYYQENKETIKEARKIYDENNKEALDTYKRQWNIDNRDRINELRRIRYKERLRTDITYRITCNLRNRLYIAVKHGGGSKSAKTLALLGCSVEYLRLYLQVKFTKGMSWDNYGEWHIDHILPCASFNLAKAAHQEQCFHYTNLQPLWGCDNLAKGSRVDH